MVSAVAGAVQTANGSAPVGGDQAKPRGAEGRAEIAVGRNVDGQLQRGGDCLQPVARARAAADRRHPRQLCAGCAQRLEAVAEGESHALQHGLRQHGAVGFMRQAR